MKIVIADALPDSSSELFLNNGWEVDAETGRPIEQLKLALSNADALMVRSATKVTTELISAAPNLKVIARAGTGVDNVDLQEASRQGILVVNAPGVNSISVAEHTFALILTVARSIARADFTMKEGRWEKKSFQGTELRGKTLGVIGLGRIGQEVVRRARAFEMNVVAYDPYISEQVAKGLRTELLSLDQVCQQSDFITLHIPSTSGTENLFNKNRFDQCKQGVCIINTARGSLIDQEALFDAIKSEQVAGAGLDVFPTEPPTHEKLVRLPQVVATPHIAASTKEAQELVGIETATCVHDFLTNGIVRNAVNFPSVSPEEFSQLQPYSALAEQLGDCLAQLASDPIKGIGIRYYGELAGTNHDILVGAVLVGLFRSSLSSTVSLVNARSIAEQRGIEIIESHSSRPRNYTSLISLKLITDSGERWAEGAVFEPGEPRLVLLDGVEVEIPLSGSLVVIRNDDQPGVIGEVGSIFGDHNLNIATFALGRGRAGAIGIVNIQTNGDEPNLEVDNKLLKALRDIKAVQQVDLVKLK
mgnify:CR=1 FL=1|tara:strand:- start:4080 stop:5675 length:1596 start_codon:yes stop_codon:yes gene_type:complete